MSTQTTIFQNLATAATPTPDRLLRWPEVQQRTGICRSHAHALAADGRFPKPVKLSGGRASAWLDSEISTWIADRIAERNSGAV